MSYHIVENKINSLFDSSDDKFLVLQLLFLLDLSFVQCANNISNFLALSNTIKKD